MRKYDRIIKIRNLQRIYQQKIRAMPLVFNLDIEKDPIFIDGRETGVEQGIEQGIDIKSMTTVEKCLLSRELSVERIADLVDVSIGYVLKIQERLKKEGKL
jgi:hypothetical protein